MAEINSTINPGVRQLAAFGDVQLPVTWGNHFETLQNGGFLEPTGSNGSALTADSAGHIYVRAGSVVVKGASGEWRVVNQAAVGTTPNDDENEAIRTAVAVGIIKATVDLKDGGGLVGIFIQGGFIAARMPSIAANATPGLEATARLALTRRGFRFVEDY